MKFFKKCLYFVIILIVLAGLVKGVLYFYRINQIEKHSNYNQNYILGKYNRIITLETWIGYEELYSRKLETNMVDILKEYPNYVNRYIKYAPLVNVYPKEKTAIINLECGLDQNKKYFSVLHKILSVNESEWDYFLRLDVLSLKKFTNENEVLRELDVEKFYNCTHSEEKDFIVKNAQSEMKLFLGENFGLPVTVIRNNLTGKVEDTITGAQSIQEYANKIENILKNTPWWQKI